MNLLLLLRRRFSGSVEEWDGVSVLLLETTPDKLLIEGDTDAILLEGRK